MKPPFRQITVLAPGLLGGSLAMAARRRGLAGSVVGWARRQETLDEGLRRGAFDRVSPHIAGAVTGADLVVIGAPVRATIELLGKLPGTLDSDAVVTDVGSTKLAVTTAGRAILGANRFVGGHPMAGSHRSGIGSASVDLLEDCRYLLTPAEGTSASLRTRLETLVDGLGAHPVWLSPEDHDHLVARISHAPHPLARVLVESAAAYERSGTPALTLASTGFRDTTRVAAGDAAMWTDICLTSGVPLLEALDDVVVRLRHIRERVASGDAEAVERWLIETARIRRTLGTDAE